MNRRQFLRDGALAIASVALMGAVRFAAHGESTLTDSRIEVLLDEPLGTISPNIYDHFAENLYGFPTALCRALRRDRRLAITT